jgi:hypothetical protein
VEKSPYFLKPSYIFLGMPGYGQQTAGAGRGFWRSTRQPDSHVTYQSNSGSLLAQNFNRLWTAALNMVHRGQPVDYFAMQHADIEPQDWWLDTLIEEMEAHDLDVLGVAVPIKDPKGLTSLALDRAGDTWSPLCRLTMSEVYSLPETFTSEDVGHPLLLNTGLWVCRFGDWARKVHFTINDRIVFDKNLDRYLAQVEPEDWYFSRLCHELKLKIGATRKIQLHHRGEIGFSNGHPWGDPVDSVYVPESQIPATGFPSDVDGWLTPEEGAALADLARGKSVLEIGSYCGRSTICLARTAAHVTSIDPHDGRGTPRPRDTFEEMKRNLERYGCQNVDVIRGLSEDFHSLQQFERVFIDGAHDEESVQADIVCALRHLAPDGLIAFHDYRPFDPGVVSAVNELLADGGEILSQTQSLAVVKPPAAFPLEV